MDSAIPSLPITPNLQHLLVGKSGELAISTGKCYANILGKDRLEITLGSIDNFSKKWSPMKHR